MSNGHLDYSKLKDREILLLLVQKFDELDGIPKRVARLERWRAWFIGVGSAISGLIGLLELRRHG